MGDLYQISFYLRDNAENGGQAPNNSFTASFAGVTGYTATNLATNDSYNSITFDTPVLATSSSSTLQFRFQNVSSFFNLDDVSVQDLGPPALATPEPSTLTSAAFAGPVGIGYGWYRRRRAKLDS